jgi:hypothetical protein
MEWRKKEEDQYSHIYIHVLKVIVTEPRVNCSVKIQLENCILNL